MIFDFEPTMKEDEINDKIRAMFRKEAAYFNSSLTSLYQNQELAIEQRNRMLKWSFKLINTNDMPKEVAAVTFSNLDRFLLTKNGYLVINDKKLFQLAAYSSLSIAIKMLASRNPHFGNNLSNGLFPSQDIIQMENIITNALQWKLNPPNIFSFINFFVELLHRKCPITDKKYYKHHLFVQAETALSDMRLLNINPSITAAILILDSAESTEHLFCALKSFSEFPFCDGLVKKFKKHRESQRKQSEKENMKRDRDEEFTIKEDKIASTKRARIET